MARARREQPFLDSFRCRSIAIRSGGGERRSEPGDKTQDFRALKAMEEQAGCVTWDETVRLRA